MVDLKDIIKWFIPCFHILRFKSSVLTTFILLFLFFNTCPVSEAKVFRYNSDFQAKNLVVNENVKSIKQSDVSYSHLDQQRSLQDGSTGRTFGLRFKRFAQALIPLAFQLGMAATWAVVAALVGVKTLAVSLIILKILIVAGAVKVIFYTIGAFFGQKAQHAHGWQPSPHQKEIHLHIHNNGQHEVYGEPPYQDEHLVPWNREGTAENPAETKDVTSTAVYQNQVYPNPYNYYPGPQTIRTPYGNYVRMDLSPGATYPIMVPGLVPAPSGRRR